MSRSRLLTLALILIMPLLAPACGQTPPVPAVFPLRVAVDREDLLDAPLLVAQARGYFRQAGLAVTFVPGGWSALSGGKAQVGAVSPEQLGPGWPGFAALDGYSGAFLLTRSLAGPFTWSSLAGKTILAGPDQAFTTQLLRFILKQHRLSTAKVLADLPPKAFRNGTGDTIVLNEPAATAWVKQKAAYAGASLGAEGGPLLTRIAAASASFLTNREVPTQGFTDAVFRAQLWLYDQNPNQIAAILAPYFPGEPPGVLSQAVRRYWVEGVWAAQPLPSALAVSRTGKLLGHSLDADLQPTFAEKALRTVY